MTRAEKIVCAILEDLDDRQGFDELLDGLDADVQSQLFKELVAVTDEVLKMTVSDKQVEALLKRFERRKRKWAGKQTQNHELPAGSPMYYYCEACGCHTETRSEGWCLQDPPRKLCADCQELKKLVLLPE